MGLSRRGSRAEAPTWPGFVDALSSLLLVLMFVLTIFMIVQFVLRDTISTQNTELGSLSEQVASLADALGLAKLDAAKAKDQIGQLTSQLADAKGKADQQSALIATLNSQLTARQGELTQAQAKITSFEAQVASLLADRDAARGQVAALGAQVTDLKAARDKLQTEQDALNLAVAKARSEVDAQTEAARLAAARTEALQALIADLHNRADASAAALSDAEKQRITDAAAAEALRAKLKDSQAELTAMTLALEAQRKKAEDTLTLLAAARAAADQATQTQMTEAQKQAALLSVANDALSKEQAKSAESARQVELLNQQVAALRTQLQSLQGILDASAAKDKQNSVQIQALGSQLNAALAQVAEEQKRRADLEAAARAKLEAENKNLSNYRSEFFGKVSAVMAGVSGVKVVGDRFVFSSEVLFPPGSADLSPAGQAEIAKVVAILKEVAAQIPPDINWILQVNGFTDNQPLSGTGQFRDNWELSTARALSVVHYMVNGLHFPPDRLAATGFGEFQPVATGDTPEARAQNRRIELKLTEK
jgi:chemotaxis protein MotB